MTLNEVSPPGWGHTKAEKEKTKPWKPKSKIGGTAAAFKRALDDGRFKGLPGSKTKKEKTADMFKLMWSMKKKGDKPHYKPGTDKKYKKYQEEETSMPNVSTNDKKAINKRAKNLFKKDLKGTHDSVNEASGGGVPLSPQELEIQKKMARLNVRLARKRSQALSQAKTKDTETAPEQVKEGSLHKWFKGSKSKDGKKGWVNVVTGGTCASDEPGEGTPKCVSSAKRASMTKAERLSASRRKKAADPGQQQKTGAAKPTYVRTDSKKKMKEETSMQDNNLFGNAFAYEKLKKKIGSKKKHDKPAMESVITMIGRKKKEKTASKAMDAGARARRAMKRREHAKYVSGSTENVPRELEDQVQYEDRDLKKIAKELDGASKMHKGQANRIRKHLKDMRNEAKDVKLETKKNCGCGQDPCVTFGKKELTQAQKVDEGMVDMVKKGAKRHKDAVEKKKIKNRKAVPYAALAAQHEPEGDIIDEACWKGYKAYGMKKKGNRMVPNCKPIGSVKKEEVQTEAKVDKGRSDYGKASIRNYRRKGPGYGEPAMFDPENKRGKLIDKRREEHKARRGVKGAKVPAYKVDEDYYAGTGEKVAARTKKYMEKKGMKGAPGLDAMKARTAEHKAKRGVKEEVVLETKDKKGKGSGTKDACYHKVKASAKVWPSAYASGRLVQCRKKGASNYGKSKSESYSWSDQFDFEGEYVQEGKTFSDWKKAASKVLGKKDQERKPEKAMDAGARLRRKKERQEYAAKISGSEDNVPDEMRD